MSVGGQVRHNGDPLASASVTLAYAGMSRVEISSANGVFSFGSVPVNTPFTLSATFGTHSSNTILSSGVIADSTNNVLDIDYTDPTPGPTSNPTTLPTSWPTYGPVSPTPTPTPTATPTPTTTPTQVPDNGGNGGSGGLVTPTPTPTPTPVPESTATENTSANWWWLLLLLLIPLVGYVLYNQYFKNK